MGKIPTIAIQNLVKWFFGIAVIRRRQRTKTQIVFSLFFVRCFVLYSVAFVARFSFEYYFQMDFCIMMISLGIFSLSLCMYSTTEFSIRALYFKKENKQTVSTFHKHYMEKR